MRRTRARRRLARRYLELAERTELTVVFRHPDRADSPMLAIDLYSLCLVAQIFKDEPATGLHSLIYGPLWPDAEPIRRLTLEPHFDVLIEVRP